MTITNYILHEQIWLKQITLYQIKHQFIDKEFLLQKPEIKLCSFPTGAQVHAQTQTGDTALTYACENGHTTVGEVLLDHGAELEHESEGGRTPLMKAARAGHYSTVEFLISKGADVNRTTTTNDHTVLSLSSAGGHLQVGSFGCCL